MTQAIRDAGFTPVPEQVGLTLTGVLESRSGRYVLVLDRMQKSKDVVCVPASGEASEAALRAGPATPSSWKRSRFSRAARPRHGLRLEAERGVEGR